MHFIKSSIICHVIWYQILPDITWTLHLVSCVYLLIINMPFVIKILAYKTSSSVFILHRTKCYTHNYIKHHLPRQMIPDISRYHALSRQLLVPFDYNLPFNFKIVAYKTSSWVFILYRKKCNMHNYIKNHQPRQMIPDISRYHA